MYWQHLKQSNVHKCTDLETYKAKENHLHKSKYYINIFDTSRVSHQKKRKERNEIFCIKKSTLIIRIKILVQYFHDNLAYLPRNYSYLDKFI